MERTKDQRGKRNSFFESTRVDLGELLFVNELHFQATDVSVGHARQLGSEKKPHGKKAPRTGVVK